MWQTYYTPSTLSQAFVLLAEHGPAARVIAGGTDLLLELERGARQASVLIDITRIPGLDAIQLLDDGLVHLGALVTHNQVVADPLCVERALPLVQACWQVGAPQIRNRGTLAGNLITASPANDSITPLWAMDGRVTLTSLRDERRLTFPEFFLGVRRTDLRPDEMLTDIAFRPLRAGQRGTFLKVGLRAAQAVSVVNVALVVGLADGDGQSTGRVTEAAITLGSVAPTILRAAEAEGALVGQPLSDRSIRLAAERAALAAQPIDDVRGSAEYRRYMVGVTVGRGLEQLRAGTEQAGIPARPVMLWGRTDGRFPNWGGGAVPPPVVHARDGEQLIETTVNGQTYRVRGGTGKTLLRLLREDIGLTGTKEGCAEGECGACTVLLDGIAVMSCLVPAPRAHGSRIVTIEGLGTPGALHPLQQAFIDQGAVQCGYCTPGFIMSAASLLEEKPVPSQGDIQQALTGNLCRCTGYYSIISAIEQAARVAEMGGEHP
jgi:xanthine dehydrogenase iron-sulfur cluster and FAD-binding subunit A